jgi:hypothetical protein
VIGKCRQRGSVFSSPLLLFALCFVESALAQPSPFSSGSTGSDGALNIKGPGITYFNPKTLNLTPAIPNVFNFTTITIAAGSTLKFTEEVFHGPVFLLATGNVDIEGAVQLNGDVGADGHAGQTARIPSFAGSGGYSGGLGKPHVFPSLTRCTLGVGQEGFPRRGVGRASYFGSSE